MRPRGKDPELAEAINGHARAVLARDEQGAERLVTDAALETYRLAMKEAARLGPFDQFAAPGLARLGAHYVSKVRFAGARGSAMMQIRWKREADGHWRIAEAEYFPPGRTPWTGVGRPKPANVGNANA